VSGGGWLAGMNAVVGVIGCSGGVGSSGLAACLARAAGGATVIDLDEAGGGLDVLLAIEHEPGARWSDLRGAGGRIQTQVLRRGLPQWGGCAVLAADSDGLDGGTVTGLVRAAADAGPTVLDLPRAATATRAVALRCCDLVLLVVRADVVGVAAAHAVSGALGGAAAGVVVRRGHVPPEEVAAAVALPLLGVLPALSAGPPSGRTPRAVAALAAGVWAGLGGVDDGRAGAAA
jgi:hypothetical protein